MSNSETSEPLPSVIKPEVWHRLHPFSPAIRVGPALIPIIFILLTSFANNSNQGVLSQIFGHGVAIFVLITLGIVSWVVTRWRIEGGSIHIETGIIRRSSYRYPIAQIQAIDIVRPLLARVLGLSELRLRSGGETNKAARLAYLTANDAEIVRSRLLALAHGLDENTAPPEAKALHALPTGRLLASIALSSLGLVWLVIVIGFGVFALINEAEAVTFVVSFLFALVAFLSATWRRFNADFRLTVSEALDGFRLQSGLTQTSAETIPRGRIQAVRLTQPFFWRLFGWCRLEVDIAGKQKRRNENQSQSKQVRSLLPAGSMQQALWLLERIFPNTPSATTRPPARVRWKAPLRFHFLGYGHSDQYVVTSSGRFTKETVWIPLSKVQSLRYVQGPVQRRLRVATVHLDTAGRRMHAAIRDRDDVETHRVLWQLVDSAQRERSTSG